MNVIESTSWTLAVAVLCHGFRLDALVITRDQRGEDSVPCFPSCHLHSFAGGRGCIDNKHPFPARAGDGLVSCI